MFIVIQILVYSFSPVHGLILQSQTALTLFSLKVNFYFIKNSTLGSLFLLFFFFLSLKQGLFSSVYICFYQCVQLSTFFSLFN